MSKPNNTKKKTAASLVTILALLFMLVLTTYALVASFVSVDDHLFETGTVDIELNGGKTIFDGSDLNTEPGYSVVKDFTVENKGSAAVYYRLYLENVEGPLQEVMTFSIYDGDKLLFTGKAKEFNQEHYCQGDSPLSAGETRTLTAVVNIEESVGNAYQTDGITFDMTVDAVQAKNNPNQVFE